jgi:hypothetical protein
MFLLILQFDRCPTFVRITSDNIDGALQKTPNKIATSKKAAYRAIKLFILGIILQGYTYPYYFASQTVII